MLRKRKLCEKGFTLVELLVVIAVLGILAGVIAPRLLGVVGQAEDAAFDANVRVLRSAVNMAQIVGDVDTEFTGGTTITAANYTDEGQNLSNFIDEWPEGYEITVNTDGDITEITDGARKWSSS